MDGFNAVEQFAKIYDTLITALEVRDKKNLTMTLVEIKLIEEDEKQKSNLVKILF